ncbi:MAG: type II toxin-antitoxin system Phd/YefM family antitoxin [Gaiellaceae bacterium]
MKKATVTEAKNRLSALLAEVRAGETVVIVDRGLPVAHLGPVIGHVDDAGGRLARLQRAGALRPARGEPPVALVGEEPPKPAPGTSAVAALLAERSTGR